MERKKNIIMIAVEVILIAAIVFTSGAIKFGKKGDMPQGGQQPPQMSQEQSESTDGTESSDNSDTQKQTPPEMPDGESQTPPEKPDDENFQAGDGQTPPEMPDGEEMPEKPDGDFDPSQGGQNGAPGEMPSNMGGMRILRIALTGFESLLFVVILIYLIMSSFNKKTFKETFTDKKRIIAFIVASMVAAATITAAATILPKKLMANNMPQGEMQQAGDSEGGDAGSTEATGANTVDGEEKELNGEYSSKTADENVILVENGGTLSSDGASISKLSGDGSNTDNCDFYGINAAILVNSKSSATIKNATITSKADKSNAVFCTGEGSKITVSDSTITTSGKSSCRGLDATYGGTIIAKNVKVSTKGGSCAAVATDRGEGTIDISNSELSTEGAGSPLIYSTGKITLSKTKGSASGSQIVVVEGKNSATVKNSNLTAEGTGNRGDVDVCGIMLYQSMSGDADEGTSAFTATSSTLSINEDSNYYDSAPMFFVTNTEAVIKLTNTELNYGSGVLLNAEGTSEWGETDSNGGIVKLIASKQKLTGDIVLDSLSKLTFKLQDGSTYKGTINGDKKAKSVKLSLSEDSKIVLTGDSYVSALDDEDESYSNIDFNGYKLYVDGKAIN